MKPDLFTFPDTESGLSVAWDTTIALRRAGFKTRLAERQMSGYTVHTVVATPPVRPTRKERGVL